MINQIFLDIIFKTTDQADKLGVDVSRLFQTLAKKPSAQTIANKQYISTVQSLSTNKTDIILTFIVQHNLHSVTLFKEENL